MLYWWKSVIQSICEEELWFIPGLLLRKMYRSVKGMCLRILLTFNNFISLFKDRFFLVNFSIVYSRWFFWHSVVYFYSAVAACSHFTLLMVWMNFFCRSPQKSVFQIWTAALFSALAYLLERLSNWTASAGWACMAVVVYYMHQRLLFAMSCYHSWREGYFGKYH